MMSKGFRYRNFGLIWACMATKNTPHRQSHSSIHNLGLVSRIAFSIYIHLFISWSVPISIFKISVTNPLNELSLLSHKLKSANFERLNCCGPIESRKMVWPPCYRYTGIRYTGIPAYFNANLTQGLSWVPRCCLGCDSRMMASQSLKHIETGAKFSQSCQSQIKAASSHKIAPKPGRSESTWLEPLWSIVTLRLVTHWKYMKPQWMCDALSSLWPIASLFWKSENESNKLIARESHCTLDNFGLASRWEFHYFVRSFQYCLSLERLGLSDQENFPLSIHGQGTWFEALDESGCKEWSWNTQVCLLGMMRALENFSGIRTLAHLLDSISTIYISASKSLAVNPLLTIKNQDRQVFESMCIRWRTERPRHRRAIQIAEDKQHEAMIYQEKSCWNMFKSISQNILRGVCMHHRRSKPWWQSIWSQKHSLYCLLQTDGTGWRVPTAFVATLPIPP